MLFWLAAATGMLTEDVCIMAVIYDKGLAVDLPVWSTAWAHI